MTPDANSNLEAQFAHLNPEQREAVEHIDGPLLVIAGPGTGKTQLLSLRAANILAKRDVAPENLLCLTFGNAGAEAMRKRLVRLIGRDAYGIEVSTFHSFAESVRMRWPEFFSRGADSELASDLCRLEIVNGLLNGLAPDNALYAGRRDGVNAKLSDTMAFIGHFKLSGLTTHELREISSQTLEFLDRAEGDEAFMDMVNAKVPAGAAKKEQFCADFETQVERLCSLAPAELRASVVETPGMYVPYARWLRDTVRRTELMGDDGKTSGFSELRSALFEGTAKEGRTFKDRKVCKRMLAAADIYDDYEAELEARGLYDYDDMILDAIGAIRTSPELQHALHERYRYIQVDEFQDTNGAQMRLLELLAGASPAPDIMAVCDDDQAIMRFQGATIECIQQFQERWHPHNIVLKTNYRSTSSIVEFGKMVAAQIERRLPASSTDKDVVAFRGDGEDRGGKAAGDVAAASSSSACEHGSHAFCERVYLSQDAERFALAREIRRRIDEGFIASRAKPDEAIAVIAPKHAPLKELIPYLNHFDIPFAYNQTANVFQMESMQTLLAIMRFAAFSAMGRTARAEAQLPRIVAAKEFGLAPGQCLAFARDVQRDHHGSWMDALRSCAEAAKEQAEDKASSYNPLARLYDDLSRWATDALASPVRETLMRMAYPLGRYYQEQSENDPWAFAEFNAGIRALLRFIDGELLSVSRKGGADERAPRLTDVVERADELARYGVTIDASISLGKEGAVRLLTAHGSKGLEFDCVYMLDADDAMWHKGRTSSAFFPLNMLVGNAKDDDDARRLLFVALTRAKDEMELFRSGGETLRELQGELETLEAGIGEGEGESAPDLAAEIIQTSWEAAYAVDTPEFRALLVPDLVPLALSASALNDFVEYADGSTNSLEFPAKRMLRLPGNPSSAMDFGNLVHAYLEDYVNRVLKGGADPDELAQRYRDQVLWMDYRDEELKSLSARFDRIASVFAPWLGANVQGRLVTEARLSTVTDGDVPLSGFCDLLLVDDESKQVRVIDYKTGFSYPGKKPTTGYERQLQFYKLLVEGSSEFRGYTVVECADFYVEPEIDTHELHEPVRTRLDDSEIDRLSRLVAVVWRRIQQGDFDTSAFEESRQKADAVAHNLTAKGEPRKNMDHRLIQKAYEDWLLEVG